MAHSIILPLITLMMLVLVIHGYQDAFAIVYNNDNNNYFDEVNAENFKAAFIYTGGIETYCRGKGDTELTEQCHFSGNNPNSYVRYEHQDTALLMVVAEFFYDPVVLLVN